MENLQICNFEILLLSLKNTFSILVLNKQCSYYIIHYHFAKYFITQSHAIENMNMVSILSLYHASCIVSLITKYNFIFIIAK